MHGIKLNHVSITKGTIPNWTKISFSYL